MIFPEEEQTQLNEQAMRHPQPGDYWQEMFCPYFLVVQVKVEQGQDRFVVLSAMKREGEPYARIDNGDGTWSFDCSKSMIVDRQWIEDRVQYGTISGFVADVVRSDRTRELAETFVEYEAQRLMKEFRALGPTASKYLIESEYD